jgi:L-ascorbate metabolism protein UlaG (beta-lactamase superfamily)
MSLTYLGHSAVRFEVGGLSIYVDPYLRDPIDWTKLPKGDLVLLSHGHFDHGVLMSPKLFESWRCQFAGPQVLMRWMARKYRRVIPAENFISLDQGQRIAFRTLKILATPAHHPVNRLGKTLMTVFARRSAPGKPVIGFYIDGYYHSGDTIYTPEIAKALKGLPVHTACLPIGGKYAVASPAEALRIAREIGASRIVPLHWQALMEQVPFRYQSSDLVKLAKSENAETEICPLAIGQVLALPGQTSSTVVS